MATAFARFPPVTVLVASCLLASCGVNVHRDDGNGAADVDIKTPVGSLSVHTDVDPPETDLPVYPGARPSVNRDGSPGNADVSLGSPFFGGVKIVAARFEHDDAPEAIVDFYRDRMKAFGEVTVCRGNVDFVRRSGARRPICKARTGARQVQLVTGTGERHRMVVVEPRGSGAEFAIVYVETDTHG